MPLRGQRWRPGPDPSRFSHAWRGDAMSVVFFSRSHDGRRGEKKELCPPKKGPDTFAAAAAVARGVRYAASARWTIPSRESTTERTEDTEEE